MVSTYNNRDILSCPLGPVVRHAHCRLAYFGSLVSFLFLLLPGLALAQAPERTPSKEADFKKIETLGWETNPTRAVSHRDDMIRAKRFWLKSEASGRFHDRLRPERPVSGVSAVKPVAQVSVTICDRTAAVVDAILSRISTTNDCSEVRSTQLAAITGTLNLGSRNLSGLQAGDFDGLNSVTGLDLRNNRLAVLPEGIFDDLTSLTSLHLGTNDLTTLPDGINELVSLPDGIFDQLTSLTRLGMAYNDLHTLPDGIFKNLTQLPLGWSISSSIGLSLNDNPGAPFRPVVNAGADLMVQSGTTVSIPGSVTGPWGDFVRWEWIQVDGLDSDIPISEPLPLTGGDTATPSFAAPMAEGDLHFRLVATPGHEGAPDESLGYANSDPDWVTVRVATATNTTEHPSVVDFALLGNYPNPFNPSTTILLDVPQVAAVSVEVFNVLGQRVHREDFPVVTAGPSKPLPLYVSHLSSGTYVYQVTAHVGEKVYHAGRRMTVVK
ncbi:MAG: T9SS type A sorting domain-containing protein [Rhodothermaceae bacterium]|nr:T9SS type A sorting domain-containing protein [Rhodothermaceae bacterium]MYJ56903.1 T9SS type A sorting domain-containing protein [Rhodothermaceae bacterium]